MPLSHQGQHLINQNMSSNKILLVEDDYQLRLMIKTVFELSGIEIDTACNGQEAWVYLNQHPAPALMLLDLMMPVMDGLELLDKLKIEGRLGNFPIIILSAIADGKSLNPYGYPALTKPIRMQALLDLGKKYGAVPASDESGSKQVK